MSCPDAEHHPDAAGPARWVPLIRLVAGGVAGATVLSLLQVPAGALIGAVAGSTVANRLRSGGGGSVVLPAPARTAGLILLGCIAGVRLDAGTFVALGRIAAPLAVAVLALLLLNVALAAVFVKRYDVDPVTAVLACAPGGISEISVVAQASGARTEVVFAVHAVRVLAVVLVVLPVLVVVLAR